MELTKVMNNEMEVAMAEGMMIGRCRGPIKAILSEDSERIQAILDTVKVNEIIEETNVISMYQDIDVEDYGKFCEWMRLEGGIPSIEEYRQAIQYYSVI